MATLRQINTLPPDQYVELLGGVFEHSPWVAERTASGRPYADVGALHTAMVHAVESASADERLALLRAHPELAGREAQAGAMTAASQSEQSSAGLAVLDRDALGRIGALNARYRSKFGFPFIIAVRNHTRESIFAALERRVENDPDTEHRAALAEVYAITRMRLDRMITD